MTQVRCVEQTMKRMEDWTAEQCQGSLSQASGKPEQRKQNKQILLLDYNAHID